jgi:hypothetical protein
MDRLTVLQDTIDQTQQLRNRYGDPHPGVHEIHAVDIMTSVGTGEREWPLGSLQRILRDIAGQHLEECDDGITECPTCVSIADGLAVSMAALRWQHEEELERRIAEVAE